jgi:hypothetical protein
MLMDVSVVNYGSPVKKCRVDNTKRRLNAAFSLRNPDEIYWAAGVWAPLFPAGTVLPCWPCGSWTFTSILPGVEALPDGVTRPTRGQIKMPKATIARRISTATAHPAAPESLLSYALGVMTVSAIKVYLLIARLILKGYPKGREPKMKDALEGGISLW